jgi:hypothetical protein
MPNPFVNLVAPQRSWRKTPAGVAWQYIEPGKPTQNAFIECLNGQLKGPVYSHAATMAAMKSGSQR